MAFYGFGSDGRFYSRHTGAPKPPVEEVGGVVVTRRTPTGADPITEVGAHPFVRRGWRWWICHHCYAPKSLHPRPGYRRARPLGDNTYLSADAPHFKEGW